MQGGSQVSSQASPPAGAQPTHAPAGRCVQGVGRARPRAAARLLPQPHPRRCAAPTRQVVQGEPDVVRQPVKLELVVGHGAVGDLRARTGWPNACVQPAVPSAHRTASCARPAGRGSQCTSCSSATPLGPHLGPGRNHLHQVLLCHALAQPEGGRRLCSSSGVGQQHVSRPQAPNALLHAWVATAAAVAALAAVGAAAAAARAAAPLMRSLMRGRVSGRQK